MAFLEIMSYSICRVLSWFFSAESHTISVTALWPHTTLLIHLFYSLLFILLNTLLSLASPPYRHMNISAEFENFEATFNLRLYLSLFIFSELSINSASQIKTISNRIWHRIQIFTVYYSPTSPLMIYKCLSLYLHIFLLFLLPYLI